jgi:hypothetical protein
MSALKRSIRHGWPDKPTLLIIVLAPGHGAETWIEGRGMGPQMARHAARDLWVPTRSRRSGHWPVLRYGDATVALLGGRRAPSVESASIHVVAQLIQELSFRWGKTHHDAYRLAKSSQNPG